MTNAANQKLMARAWSFLHEDKPTDNRSYGLSSGSPTQCSENMKALEYDQHLRRMLVEVHMLSGDADPNGRFALLGV